MTKTAIIPILSFSILSLAGCTPPPTDAQVCASYGLPYGTLGFAQCMEQRSEQRAQLKAAYLAHMQNPAPILNYQLPVDPTYQTHCFSSGPNTSCTTQ